MLENVPEGKGSDVPGGRLHALLRPSLASVLAKL